MRSFLFRTWDRVKPRFKTAASLTFCIAHFNGADFLEACLQGVRGFYPDARIIVADSKSAGSQYLAARRACGRYSAELHPMMRRSAHTITLDHLYRLVETDVAVFLDQDTLLLESLDPLLEKAAAGRTWLAGPRDEMQVVHQKPDHWDGRFRRDPDYIHASLMVVNVRQTRNWIGPYAFEWDPAFGPRQTERYYGLVERLRRHGGGEILPLTSSHTGYGLGMLYLYQDRPIAYHNWYSGRIFGKRGTLDANGYDAQWLAAEKDRFLKDYWAGKVNFEGR